MRTRSLVPLVVIIGAAACLVLAGCPGDIGSEDPAPEGGTTTPGSDELIAGVGYNPTLDPAGTSLSGVSSTIWQWGTSAARRATRK